MHAGLIIYGSLDTPSGGYLYDRQLVAHLRAAGDTVEIISLPWSSYGRHLAHNLSPDLWQRLRHGHFDVLLQDELNHPSLFALNRRLRGQINYPLVAIVHHLRSSENQPRWQQPLYRGVERAYLRSLDAAIYNSVTTRTAVAGLAGRALPGVVAYPAADHLLLPPSSAAHRKAHSGPLRLLFVGNIIPRKNLHGLLDALALLPGEQWRLAIVGDAAPDPAYARRLRARSAALHSNVTWHGRVSSAELAGHFARSDLFVLPSFYEGFGIVYLEALAWGLPVVAGDRGAAHELISSGVNGFLVPPDDPAALAQALRPLLAQPAQLEPLRAAARARFADAPKWSDSMGAVREFLLRIIATTTPNVLSIAP